MTMTTPMVDNSDDDDGRGGAKPKKGEKIFKTTFTIVESLVNLSPDQHRHQPAFFIFGQTVLARRKGESQIPLRILEFCE
jgi:hypothetical protein